MNKSEGGARKKGGAQEQEANERMRRRVELQRVLVETIHGILDGRISQKEAWAIGRRVDAELRLLRLMERLQPMVEREKAEAKRARAQALKAPVAQGKEWVN